MTILYQGSIALPAMRLRLPPARHGRFREREKLSTLPRTRGMPREERIAHPTSDHHESDRISTVPSGGREFESLRARQQPPDFAAYVQTAGHPALPERHWKRRFITGAEVDEAVREAQGERREHA